MNALFQKIAAENGTTTELVYREIQSAINTAMQSGDTDVQEKWREMSGTHETPSPEEAIRGILTMLLTGTDTH
jgi:hypothetical protein